MTRIVLVHLNIEVADPADTRTPAEIAQAILDRIEDDPADYDASRISEIAVYAPLAEEV